MDKSLPLSLQMAISIKEYYRPGMMKWHYEHGLVQMAALASSDYHKDETIFPWVYDMYSVLIGEDGSIATYREGEYNLDQINAGRNLYPLFDRTKEERFRKAQDRLASQLKTQPRCKNGVFWHKEIYPWQIWLDGLYMEGPYSAEYASRYNMPEKLEDICKQLMITYETLKDEKTGLLYHGYDDSRGMKWSDDITGLSPHFWSRAIGWFCMATLDVLDFVPQDHSYRKQLEEMFVKLITAVSAFQSESGMWWQVTDQGSRAGNYLETSGSSMFAYSMLKGIRIGLLPNDFREKALLALADIKERYLSEDSKGFLHLDGTCSVAGLGNYPYRDGSFAYYISEPIRKDDYKGVGPFILACLESEK